MLFKNCEQIIKNGKTKELKEIRKDALEILNSAINSVDSYNAVKTRLTKKGIIFREKIFDVSKFKNIYLIGFGKASIGMTQAVCDSLTIKDGAIITNELDKNVKKSCISTFIGSHPIPSQKSIDSTEKLIEIVDKCDEDDLLIVLISGGGSALLCKPRVSIYDLQQATDLLLKSGANINEINTIRKHLSFVKGGQLAAQANSTIVSFIISDIIGNPIEFIASTLVFTLLVEG